jgi:hypothetical protein
MSFLKGGRSWKAAPLRWRYIEDMVSVIVEIIDNRHIFGGLGCSSGSKQVYLLRRWLYRVFR